MIYYEFNRTGNDGKYKEMTEAEYEMAMQDPNRFFLEGWDDSHKKLIYMIECSREVFDQVRHEQYGIENRQRDKSNRKAVVLSLEQDVDDCGEASSVFGSGICPVDEQVQMELFGEYVRYFRKKRLGWLGTSEGLEPHADREDAVWLKCSFCRRGQACLSENFRHLRNIEEFSARRKVRPQVRS